VRSITPNRRTSRDAACTMVIGKDTPLGPSNVKASHVTSTSAIISWLPSNSNHQHVVCVNNVEVRTVKPGVYRHTITGMAIFLLQRSIHVICVCVSYEGYPESNLRFGIKKTQVKRNIFYYINLKATILNHFSTHSPFKLRHLS
jgi:hypothetical protein